MLALDVRRLHQRDRTTDFRSGNELLDQFFRGYAKKNEAQRTTATFVACVADAIVGFVTIAPKSVQSAMLREHVRKLAKHDTPVLLIARMATDSRFQSKGVGATLLRDAVFARAAILADGFGCVGVYVDPKAAAVPFYAKHGFMPLPGSEDPSPMFLPLETVLSAMGVVGLTVKLGGPALHPPGAGLIT